MENELNPYLEDGSGGNSKNDEVNEKRRGVSQLPPPPVVDDGGASWRLKTLKRAQEQVAREGQKFDEVVEKRWGSFGKMTKSVATTRGAPTHVHLHAIRDKNWHQNERPELGGNGDNDSQIERNDQRIENNKREYLKNVSSHDSHMKASDSSRCSLNSRVAPKQRSLNNRVADLERTKIKQKFNVI
eukprot:Gb_34447 [translate_table: standard]